MEYRRGRISQEYRRWGRPAVCRLNSDLFSVGGMVAAAGALEMTGGQRVELEGLARSHTAPARDARQAEALLWAAEEGTAAVGRARAADQGSMMRPARASGAERYLLCSYCLGPQPRP